jgi:hypothetical protein
MLELGRGFSFVARQKRMRFDDKDFYVDLVFYNYLLKCFVLIDLKIGDLSHQDIGQMDGYVRMYEAHAKVEGDNPTIGGVRVRIQRVIPHPNPLPEGDGTYSAFPYLYFFDDERHKLPHIHAKYQGQDASFSLLDGAILAGEINKGKAKLVQAWIEIHHEALMANWELAVNGEAPFRIEPLQ